MSETEGIQEVVNNDSYCLVLPSKVSIENVSSFYNEILRLEKKQPPCQIQIDLRDTREFDSSGITFLNYLIQHHPNVKIQNVPTQFPLILKTQEAKPPARPEKTEEQPGFWIHLFQEAAADLMRMVNRSLQFLRLLADELYYTFQYLFRTRRGVYPGEVRNQLFFMAYKSFPIVSLIAFLVGITIAITSAQQLRRFGADIYVADLVGFGMIRELVPLMTGIILAGKIGASITAEIASMKVMEETDALKTMGIIPEKFLMVPRLLAITFTIPLMVAIADFIGIGAGVFISRVISGISPAMFLNEMFLAVNLMDFLIGLMKTLIFGWTIVISAGYKAFSVRHGATEVGIATTQSVVLSISLIIIIDCIFAILLY
ncbi:MAG: ABC transporter permease [Candidatus Omnitrophota bacterium]